MLLIIAVSGLVNFCAITFGKKSAPVITSGLVIILWTVGGIQITTQSIHASLGGFGAFLIAISPFHSSFELHMTTELVQYSEIWDSVVQGYLNNFGYTLHHFLKCKVRLFLYFLLANCSAVLMLLWKRDNFIYWRTFRDHYILPVQLKIKNSAAYQSFLQFNHSVEANAREVVQNIHRYFSPIPPENLYTYAHVNQKTGEMVEEDENQHQNNAAKSKSTNQIVVHHDNEKESDIEQNIVIEMA